MRLDKFLKVSRLIKRRTVANTVSENGRVCSSVFGESRNRHNPCGKKEKKVKNFMSRKFVKSLLSSVIDYTPCH